MPANHQTHEGHTHTHSPDCGHPAIEHNGHVDYLHDGHLHRLHGDHVDEHQLDVSGQNPAACTPDHSCSAHGQEHRHGAGCGHQAVPHGDHVDYLAGDHLHHPHGGHCDNHGPIRFAR